MVPSDATLRIAPFADSEFISSHISFGIVLRPLKLALAMHVKSSYISYLAVSRGRMCASTTLTRKAHRDEGTDTCSPATANTSVAGPSAIDNRQSTTALQISAC